MNKKLLFATVALAALTACTNDEIENIGGSNVAEGTSPIQFELVNDDAATRASLKDDGVSVGWSAADGDLFTLYHGVTYATPQPVTGYQNATYTAKETNPATLTTPSMILPGGAIMVYPVDTVFNIKSGDNLSISIPEELPAEKIENYIPHVSDLIQIEDEADYKKPTAGYNKAGYKRTYPIYMRPMASQLILHADYGTTEDDIAKLYEGGSEQPEDGGIAPITLTSVDLLTDDGGSTKFTKQIPLTFAAPTGDQGTKWNNVANNNLKQVTGVDRASATGVAKLTTKYISGTENARFLILPQKAISGGVTKAAINVNTYYGKVLIADPTEYTESKYTTAEYNAAWYRYVSNPITPATAEENEVTAPEASGEYAGKYKAVAKSVALGMQQTINFFGNYVAPATSTVRDEYMGVATNRFVKVDLKKLDMSDLHIKSDQQLRDVARVWKKLGLDDVTVILDGDDNKEFEISQKTIKVINDINGAYDAVDNPTQGFTVKACTKSGEECEKIVVTGASDIDKVQDMAFITYNGSKKVNVDLKAGETWKYKGLVKVEKTAVNRIRNYGTMVNSETATLQTAEFDGSANNIPLVNYGKWNITAGTLNVKFGVYNRDTVNIEKGAQYREDTKDFENCADNIPSRFVGGDDKQIGVIINKGVFATVNGGKINNYGLIEHADDDAKTYITSNQNGGNFSKGFKGSNKMGRINLPFSNKDEDNISISAKADQGFVSVTVTKDELAKAGVTSTKLNAGTVGTFVNYMIVNSGIDEIEDMPTQVKYVEIADKANTEIAWNVTTAQSYTGLIVLSPVNIKLGTSISATVTYLGADMYVAGTFNKAATVWDGYYGDTFGNVATKYVFFGE